MSDTILLVEDDVLSSLATAGMLEKYGYQTKTTQSGSRAVEAVRENSGISLVLMDIYLGKGMDGIEVAQQILKIRELPVIFLSNYSEESELRRAKKVPNYGYLLKNAGEFILLESISMALENFKERQKQKESSHRLQYHADLLQQIHEAIIATDLALNIISWNRAAESIYGWTEEEVLGKDLDDLLATEFLGVTQLEAQRSLARNGLWRGEVRQQRKDGGIVYMEATVSSVNDRRGKMVGGVTVNRDITARRMMEEYLRYERDLNKRIMDIGPAGIILTDKEGKTLYMNQRARLVLGLGDDYLKNKLADRIWKWMDVSGNPVSPADLPISKVISTKQAVYDFTCSLVKQDGSRSYLSINAAPLFDTDGECGNVVNILSDIGNEYRLRRQLEEQRDLLIRINGLSGITEVAEEVLTFAEALDGVDCVDMFLKEDDTENFSRIAHHGTEEVLPEQITISRDIAERFSQTVKKGEISYGAFSAFFPECSGKDIQILSDECGVIPLMQENRFLGLLTFCSFTPHSITPLVKTVMESLGQWIGDIIQKRRSEDKIIQINRELEQQKKELQEVNTTMKVLLQNMEKEQSRKADQLRSQLRHLVMPLVESLERISTGDRVSQLLGVLRSTLQSTLKDQWGEKGEHLDALTPKELQVALLIKEGKTSKEVADTLGISVHSVFFHRKNIRGKLGIRGGKTNLTAYLMD